MEVVDFQKKTNSLFEQKIGINEIESMDIEQTEQNKQNFRDINQISISSSSLQISKVQEKQLSSHKKQKKFKKVDYLSIPINETYVPSIIPSYQKFFQLPGGIVLEIQNQSNHFGQILMSNTKQIKQIQKLSNGCVSIDLESKQQINQFEHVQYILESTQNYDNYLIAQNLKDFYFHMQNISSSIQKIKESYDNEYLLNIIYERKQFLQHFQQQYISQHLQEDDFSQILTFQIEWNTQQITTSNFKFSQAFISLLGTVNEELIQFLLRNGLFLLFSYHSRRQIFEVAIKYYTYPVTDKISYDQIPDIEILTLDNMILKCNCQVQTIHIEYPQHLQFLDNTDSNINSIEGISILKFDITHDHLLKIINLRQSMIAKKDLSFKDDFIKDEENDQIAQNFEYYVQSELFLQNFYKEKYNELAKKQQKKFQQTCSYRIINQNNNI